MAYKDECLFIKNGLAGLGCVSVPGQEVLHAMQTFNVLVGGAEAAHKAIVPVY